MSSPAIPPKSDTLNFIISKLESNGADAKTIKAFEDFFSHLENENIPAAAKNVAAVNFALLEKAYPGGIENMISLMTNEFTGTSEDVQKRNIPNLEGRVKILEAIKATPNSNLSPKTLSEIERIKNVVFNLTKSQGSGG